MISGRRWPTIGPLRGFATISVALVAACGFSSDTVPAAGDDGPGVDAFVPPDVTPEDLDGDGVKNGVDNCPTKANSSQSNEDNDATGDVCDPCPHLPMAAADGDGDGDGVGDGCDPRPTQAGDAIAYFNGFNADGAGVPEGMTMVHGNANRWAVTGGYLTYTRGTVTDWGMPVVDVGKPNHVVDAAFDLQTTHPGPAASGVAVDVAANDSDGFECQSRVDTNARELWRRDLQDSDGWTKLQSMTIATATDSYRITLARTGTQMTCSNQRGTNNPVSLTQSLNSLGNTRAGLFARNVDMRFRYMIVITSP